MNFYFFTFGFILTLTWAQVSVKPSCAFGQWADCEVETWEPCFSCVLREYRSKGIEQPYQRYIENAECSEPNDLNCLNFAKMNFLKLTQTFICEDGQCGECFDECTLSCGIPPFQDTEVTHAKKASEYVAKSVSFFNAMPGHEEYSYEASTESYTGENSITKIWVKNDEIVARKRTSSTSTYLLVNADDPALPNKTAPEQIMGCANALNPDLQNKEKFLGEPNMSKYLSMDEYHAVHLSRDFGVHFMNGCIPILCYTIELGCADDCSTAYSLNKLTFNDPYVPEKMNDAIAPGCAGIQCDLPLDCIEGWKKVLDVDDECCPKYTCQKITEKGIDLYNVIHFPSEIGDDSKLGSDDPISMDSENQIMDENETNENASDEQLSDGQQFLDAESKVSDVVDDFNQDFGSSVLISNVENGQEITEDNAVSYDKVPINSKSAVFADDISTENVYDEEIESKSDNTFGSNSEKLMVPDFDEQQMEIPCPGNQKRLECGTACPKICGKDEPLYCTMQCLVGVCQCDYQQWWDEDQQLCVNSQEECSNVVKTDKTDDVLFPNVVETNELSAENSNYDVKVPFECTNDFDAHSYDYRTIEVSADFDVPEEMQSYFCDCFHTKIIIGVANVLTAFDGRKFLLGDSNPFQDAYNEICDMTMGSSECEKCAYDMPNQEKFMDDDNNQVFLQESNEISDNVSSYNSNFDTAISTNWNDYTQNNSNDVYFSNNDYQNYQNNDFNIQPISNQVLTHSHKGREITVISCPQNQELTFCGTPCPKICGQPEPEMCIEMCLTNVCQCPRGLWLDSSSGMCVEKNECNNPANPAPITQLLQFPQNLEEDVSKKSKAKKIEDIWFWSFVFTFSLTCGVIIFHFCTTVKNSFRFANHAPFLTQSGDDVMLDDDLRSISMRI